MTFWYLNRAQWRIIWAVYIVALLASVSWISRTPETRPATQQELLEELNRRAQRRTEIDREIGIVNPESVSAVQEARQKLRIEADPLLRSPLQADRTVWVERLDPSMSLNTFLTFLIFAGALAVWKLQGRNPTQPVEQSHDGSGTSR